MLDGRLGELRLARPANTITCRAFQLLCTGGYEWMLIRRAEFRNSWGSPSHGSGLVGGSLGFSLCCAPHLLEQDAQTERTIHQKEGRMSNRCGQPCAFTTANSRKL